MLILFSSNTILLPLLRRKKLLGPHPRLRSDHLTSLDPDTLSPTQSQPPEQNLDQAPSPLLSTPPPAVPSTGHPTPGTPRGCCTPTSLPLTPTLPPQELEAARTLGRRHAITCAFLPHASHAPPRLCYPLPARPSPPAGRVATWGLTTPEGYSVVSGLTMGTSWPTSDISASLSESREWSGCGAQGLHLIYRSLGLQSSQAQEMSVNGLDHYSATLTL